MRWHGVGILTLISYLNKPHGVFFLASEIIININGRLNKYYIKHLRHTFGLMTWISSLILEKDELMNSFIEELSVDAMRQKCIDVFICCAQNILKCGRGANGTKIDGSYYGRQSTLPTRPCDELGGDILGTT